MQLYPILRHVKLHRCEGNKIKAQEHALYFCKGRNGITNTSSQHMRKWKKALSGQPIILQKASPNHTTCKKLWCYMCVMRHLWMLSYFNTDGHSKSNGMITFLLQALLHLYWIVTLALSSLALCKSSWSEVHYFLSVSNKIYI